LLKNYKKGIIDLDSDNRKF